MSNSPTPDETTLDETGSDETGHAATRDADSDDVTRPIDPFDWSGGKTFMQMYLDGDIPWPEEPLLQIDAHPYEIVDEYLSLLDQQVRVARGDEDTRRRLTGEIEAATSALTRMDTYSQAAVLPRLAAYLTQAAMNPRNDPPTPLKPAQVLPELGRFNGPAPYFRRGRAYVQSLAPSFLLAAEGHGRFVSRRPDDADQLLRAVEASTDVTELQDFIAGAAHELSRQLRQLIDHPIGGDTARQDLTD